MSRSRKRRIPGTNTVRDTCGGVKAPGMKKWKSMCRKHLRRNSRQKLKDKFEEDDLILPENMVTDISRGDPWVGPHDGYYHKDVESYKDLRK